MGKPKIRFKGFTEDWEQRKLSDIVDVLDGDRGKNYPTSDDFDDSGHTLFLNASNVTNEGFLFQDNQFITEEKSNSMGNGKLEEDDIIITSRGSLGHIAWYNTGILRLVPYARINSGMLILRNKQEIETEYLYHFLKSDKGQSQISFMSFGSAQPQLTKKGVESLEVVLPPKSDEQLKIGDYFDHLDHLITLHQRKCDETKKLKKYMLQKMFPQNGMKVPEIRFGGFTGDWEQRKVGEFYDFKNGLNKGKEFFGEGTPIVNFTDVFYNRDIYAKSLKGKVTLEPNEIKNYEVKKGDIFFTRTSETIEEIGYPSVMLDVAENTVFSGFVLRGRCCQSEDPLDDLFKKYVFFTDAFREEMLKKSSMTTRALTSGTVIKNMIFRFPKSKEEQHKIAEYLTTLDYLITLHQRKRDELVKIKKYMLQNMFV